jgi:phosphoribosylanthranilate isomerase
MSLTDFTQRTRVKICGLNRLEDAEIAVRFGADAIGLVFYPQSPRHVSLETAAAIARSLAPFVTVVGLFVDATREMVQNALRTVRIDLIQFHGDEAPAYCTSFGKPYIKAVRMRPGLDLAEYAALHRDAAGLLLDAYDPAMPGGTGLAFDWRTVPAHLTLPVTLAGGLTPENVGAAIRAVRPYALDVSSGVESARGIKDPGKMAAFLKEVYASDHRQDLPARTL